jgi:membrane protein insertase Oxa1/YidC/SpoIIIJ
LNFQQLASTQKTQALNPKVQEIREKFPDNKEMQNQLVALLYQETKVSVDFVQMYLSISP